VSLAHDTPVKVEGCSPSRFDGSGRTGEGVTYFFITEPEPLVLASTVLASPR